MSLANFLNIDDNSQRENKLEIDFGDLNFDLSNIETENVVVKTSLKAPEITELQTKNEELQNQINDLKTKLDFLYDLFNIDSVNRKITINHYDFTINNGRFTHS